MLKSDCMAFLYVGILCGLKHFQAPMFGGKWPLVPNAIQIYCYIYYVYVFPHLSVFPSGLVSGFTFCICPRVYTVWGHNKS